jgi:geranylgeranyl pyrophosphate synthase
LQLSESIPHERAFRVMQLFNRAHLRMAEGQHLDMIFEGRIDIDIDRYLDITSRKTAATCECAAHAAAIVAGLDDREEAFRRFGEAFGMLYQVADDINDVWNDSGETGKTELSDLERGKATLPFLLGYERGSQRLRSILEGTGNITTADASIVRRELTRLGVDRLCREYVARYRDEALVALEEACGGTAEFHMLARMTEMCAERAGVAASGADSAQVA